MKTLLSIVGATATGKTRIAAGLARRLGTEVVSADSRQVYRGMAIGTAQPTAEEMQGVPHHLVGFASPAEPLSAGSYATLALDLIHRLFEQHEVVILCGGSGFYLDALWNGLDEIPEVPAEVRAQINQELAEKGLEPLLAELDRVDPVQAARIDRKNPRRVSRALEVYRATGQQLSALQGQRQKPQHPWRDVIIGLQPPRDLMRLNIDRRVDAMIAAGLVKEVQALKAEFGENQLSLATVGYTEIFSHLRGDISLDEAAALIKKNTWQFARRQMTWFRRVPALVNVDPSEAAQIETLLKHEGLV